MKKTKKITALAVGILVLTTTFTACGNKSGSEVEIPKLEDLGEPAAATGKMLNYTAPEKGEDIIVMSIKDYGDVKIKLFPEQAPKGVANFKTLAKKNYYNGLIFHRIIQNFMIQGGDPLGNGTGGACVWGDKFDGGVSDDLSHVAGAVAYANSGATSTNGSQFYIVTGEKYTDDILSMYESSGYSWKDEVKEAYKEYGGAPWLDGQYTIFGQVFDGLDIVFDIQNVETDASDKPSKDVIIDKITVEKYNGEDVKFYMSDYK